MDCSQSEKREMSASDVMCFCCTPGKEKAGRKEGRVSVRCSETKFKIKSIRLNICVIPAYVLPIFGSENLRKTYLSHIQSLRPFITQASTHKYHSSRYNNVSACQIKMKNDGERGCSLWWAQCGTCCTLMDINVSTVGQHFFFGTALVKNAINTSSPKKEANCLHPHL